MGLSLPIQAGFWGFVSGSALVMGALIGLYLKMPQRLIAGVMAFGAGVLISALSFELMDDAFARGGLAAAALGFLGGAALFTSANVILARAGAKHRKRSGDQQAGGGGAAIALGALIDGIPESIVIGVSLLAGKGVGMVAVIAIFLSNLPEGLSSASGMRKAGKGPGYVLGVWGGIAVASGVAAMLGCLGFAHSPPEVVAFIQAVAAGAILAMLADTMIPEAFEATHDFTGLIAVAGFLAAFALSKAAA